MSFIINNQTIRHVVCSSFIEHSCKIGTSFYYINHSNKM